MERHSRLCKVEPLLDLKMRFGRGNRRGLGDAHIWSGGQGFLRDGDLESAGVSGQLREELTMNAQSFMDGVRQQFNTSLGR